MQLFSRLFKKNFCSAPEVGLLFHQAMEQEALFEIFLNKDLSLAPATVMRLTEMKNGLLHFQAADQNLFNPNLLGANFRATFPVRRHKKIQSQIYMFGSRLEKLRKERPHTVLTTRLPGAVEKIELRRDIRIGLARELCPVIRAWKAEEPSLDKGVFNPADNSVPPALFELTAANDGPALLHDISAGGLKLSLSAHHFPEAAAYLAEDSRLQLWLLLPETGWKSPIECLLPARTTRIQHTRTGRLEFGLHFLHLSGGQIKLPNSGGWVTYTENSLQILLGWIQRRLEEFDNRAYAC